MQLVKLQLDPTYAVKTVHDISFHSDAVVSLPGEWSILM